jgi:hypothetical protein
MPRSANNRNNVHLARFVFAITNTESLRRSRKKSIDTFPQRTPFDGHLRNTTRQAGPVENNPVPIGLD